MKSLTLSQRIGITLAIVIALSGGAIAFTLWMDATIAQRMLAAEERNRRIAASTDRILYDMLQMSDGLRGMLLAPGSETERKRKHAADEDLAAMVEKLKTELADQPSLVAAIEAVGDYDEKHLHAAEEKVEELIGTDPKAAAAFYQENYLPAREAQTALVDAFVAKVRELTAHQIQRSDRARNSGIAAIVILVLVSVAVGWWQARAIHRILRRNVRSLQTLATDLCGAVQNINICSQTLASGASQQAASLEETSASLNETSAMTKRTAESAQSAKDLTGQTRDSADSGTANIRLMSAAMTEIKAASDNIAKIVKSIDEIAFQTNILALNAAVEAARAGDAGMGFAVVADEVRGLAQRSAQAARETAMMIEDSIQKSERGVQVSTTVTSSLAEIAAKIHRVDEIIGDIARASSEQSFGIEQINRAVSQMDTVTQANAGTADENAAAARQLDGHTRTLRDVVADLGMLLGESKSPEAVPPATPAVKAAPAPMVMPPRRGLVPASSPASQSGGIPMPGDTDLRFQSF